MGTPRKTAVHKSKSKHNTETSQYAHVFKELRATTKKVYADTMKLLAMEAARHVKALAEEPFWMAPQYLTKARNEVKLSQQSLAALSGVSRSAIANFESGQKIPTLGTVDRLYSALEPLGSISAANGLRGVLELDRQTKGAVIELFKRQLGGLQAAEAELAELDAQISRLDQKVAKAMRLTVN